MLKQAEIKLKNVTGAGFPMKSLYDKNAFVVEGDGYRATVATCHFPPTFEAESCFNYRNDKGGFSLYNVRYKDHSHDPVSHEVNLNLEEICNGKGINVEYGAYHNDRTNEQPVRSLNINQDEKDNRVKVSYRDGLESDTHIEARCISILNDLAFNKQSSLRCLASSKNQFARGNYRKRPIMLQMH